jgi:hypothetical protein
VSALLVGAIEVCQNEDFSNVYGFANADPSGNPSLATPISFSGSSAKMQVRQGPLSTSTQLLALTTGGGGLTLGGPTTIAGVSCGTITIAITNAQTAALPPGTWYYDCEVITATGQQTYYLQGAFIVNPSVTR